MNKSLSACPAEVWYAICTMPLFVFCWAYISTWALTIQCPISADRTTASSAFIGAQALSPIPISAAYFPFIVPPAQCSHGTRTGCGACFIQKGVHFPEPAPSATNYDPHELCRTSSETKDVLSRLPRVRFAPVPFSFFIVQKPFQWPDYYSDQGIISKNDYSILPDLNLTDPYRIQNLNGSLGIGSTIRHKLIHNRCSLPPPKMRRSTILFE